ncbi:MAG: 30S ribosome-binding factor RbfA [Parvibaculales bacterium]
MKRKTSGNQRGPSQRQLRVGELFRHRLCEVFARNELTDIKLDMRLITVTEVSASPDLRNATAFIMPLGGVGQQEAVTQLNQMAPRLRAEMSRGLRLKYVPNLVFKIDDSFDNAEAMRALLSDEKVQDDLRDQPLEDDGA